MSDDGSRAPVLLRGCARDRQVLLHHHSVNEPATVSKVVSLLNKSTGEVLKERPRFVPKNSSAVVELRFGRPVCLETYSGTGPTAAGRAATTRAAALAGVADRRRRLSFFFFVPGVRTRFPRAGPLCFARWAQDGGRGCGAGTLAALGECTAHTLVYHHDPTHVPSVDAFHLLNWR